VLGHVIRRADIGFLTSLGKRPVGSSCYQYVATRLMLSTEPQRLDSTIVVNFGLRPYQREAK
jgi:hypothetical protein